MARPPPPAFRAAGKYFRAGATGANMNQISKAEYDRLMADWRGFDAKAPSGETVRVPDTQQDTNGWQVFTDPNTGAQMLRKREGNRVSTRPLASFHGTYQGGHGYTDVFTRGGVQYGKNPDTGQVEAVPEAWQEFAQTVRPPDQRSAAGGWWKKAPHYEGDLFPSVFGGAQAGGGPPAWLANSAMAEPQGGWNTWWGALTPEQRTWFGSQNNLQEAFQAQDSLPESPGGGLRSPTGNYVPTPRSEWERNNPPGSAANQPNLATGAAGGGGYRPLGPASGLPAALQGHAPALDLEALAGSGPSTPFHWSQAEHMPAWGEDPLPDMERAALPRQQLALPTMTQPQMPTMPVQRSMPKNPARPPAQNPGVGPPATINGQVVPDYIGNPPLDNNALDEILGMIV